MSNHEESRYLPLLLVLLMGGLEPIHSQTVSVFMR